MRQAMYSTVLCGAAVLFSADGRSEVDDDWELRSDAKLASRRAPSKLTSSVCRGVVALRAPRIQTITHSPDKAASASRDR